MKAYQNIKVEKIPEIFGAAITTGTAVHTCFQLEERGFDKSFSQFLVPSFILFFGVPLCANLVYKQIVIDHMVLGSYFLGLSIFFLTRDLRFARMFSYLFPMIGRALMLCDMKNSCEPLVNVVTWLIMNEFVGMVVQKIFFGEETTNFTHQDFTILVGSIIVVFVGRSWFLPDIFVLLGALSIAALSYARQKRRTKGVARGAKKPATPGILKTPKRKAAIQNPGDEARNKPQKSAKKSRDRNKK